MIDRRDSITYIQLILHDSTCTLDVNKEYNFGIYAAAATGGFAELWPSTRTS